LTEERTRGRAPYATGSGNAIVEKLRTDVEIPDQGFGDRFGYQVPTGDRMVRFDRVTCPAGCRSSRLDV